MRFSELANTNYKAMFGNSQIYSRIYRFYRLNSSEVLCAWTAASAQCQRPRTSRSPSLQQAQGTPLPWCWSPGRPPCGPEAAAPGAGRSNSEEELHAQFGNLGIKLVKKRVVVMRLLTEQFMIRKKFGVWGSFGRVPEEGVVKLKTSGLPGWTWLPASSPPWSSRQLQPSWEHS